jgi:hypothetical protein
MLRISADRNNVSEEPNAFISRAEETLAPVYQAI